MVFGSLGTQLLIDEINDRMCRFNFSHPQHHTPYSESPLYRYSPIGQHVEMGSGRIGFQSDGSVGEIFLLLLADTNQDVIGQSIRLLFCLFIFS
jgi:hypothetical protein